MTAPFGIIYSPQVFDDPGTINFTTAGAASFTVPKFQNSITFQLHGAGAGGTGILGTDPYTYYAGTDGGNTTIASLGLTARGGLKTGYGQTATGGNTTNIAGRNTNQNTSPGSDPRSQNPGWWPSNGAIGAGGQGDWESNKRSVQGGSGAYLVHTLARGLITPGTVLALVIGTPGSGGAQGGGAGVRGQISITWS